MKRFRRDSGVEFAAKSYAILCKRLMVTANAALAAAADSKLYSQHVHAHTPVAHAEWRMVAVVTPAVHNYFTGMRTRAV